MNSTLKNTSNDLQEVNSKTLSDIQNLQNIERDLFNSLETQNLQKQLSSDELTRSVNKINDISQMRINLYKSLNNLNTFYNSELSNSAYTLNQQTTAIKIVENELNESKKRLAIIEREKNNKIRIVEINNYFGEKYAEQTGLLKSILFFAFLFMILSILLKYNIIPTKLYFVLLIIIGIFAMFNLYNKIYSIMIRDNMNYQEYNWAFNPPAGSYNESSVPTTSDPWGTGTPSLTCIGQACCYSGSTYDSTQNICIPNTSSSSSTLPTNTLANTTLAANTLATNAESYLN
jgi:hypothetical protein